jgi:hypothetical protein
MRSLSFVIVIALLTACGQGRGPVPAAPDYDSPAAWYTSLRGGDADIFYISSTETLDHPGPGGRILHFAEAADSAACPGIRMEMEGVDSRFGGSLDFYSPFYRQITMETYLKDKTIRKRFPVALDDARRAFAHYLEHMNNGRPFVLAGFSQGGQIVVELLKEMPDSIAQRMIAAYVLGWKISEEELAKYPVIRPAQRSDDTGVTVCYNSVSSPEAASELVSGGNAVAINPVNWRTDSTPAIMHDTLTVRLDQATKLLIVSGYDRVDYDTSFFRPGCYHTFEIRWYSDYLRENIEERTRAWLEVNGREESGDGVIPAAA